MKLIDSHIHVSSRTVFDLVAMRKAGIVAVVEPSFWLGQLRTNIGSFQDYFSSLIGWERFRTEQVGIKHYCTIGLNAKEANNESLAEEVMELLPLFICKEGVVAVGEIGFDDQTALEERYFRKQLELAHEMDLLVVIHTPHRDKKNGTLRSMDICEEMGIEPHRVIVDHNNEETVQEVLERGFWAGFTIYPKTKMNKERMTEIVRHYGAERIIVNSSADWGYSDHLAVPKTAALMLQRGIAEDIVRQVCYANALEMYSQSGQFHEEDWSVSQPGEQHRLFYGNTLLRGQDPDEVDFE